MPSGKAKRCEFNDASSCDLMAWPGRPTGPRPPGTRRLVSGYRASPISGSSLHPVRRPDGFRCTRCGGPVSASAHPGSSSRRSGSDRPVRDSPAWRGSESCATEVRPDGQAAGEPGRAGRVVSRSLAFPRQECHQPRRSDSRPVDRDRPGHQRSSVRELPCCPAL